jgi:hypothetical protein
MGRFRKKPVVVDAWRFTGQDRHEWPMWVKSHPTTAAFYDDIAASLPCSHITIGTLEGEMRADRGDWIIRGVKGELYPCKPDIFEATYEPALSTPAAQPVEGDWRSFETAPKDGDYILAIVAPNESRHLGHHSGRMFVIRHEGYTAPSEFDMGWAVYPGFGGAPDSYFSLWMPLPSAPQQAREGQS